MRPFPPLFARLARRSPGFVLGLLAGLAISACTFTTDFDAPYPGDPASDICESDCRNTVQCLAKLECSGREHADQMARFEGYCQADCRKNNDNAFRVGACPGTLYDDLAERYPDLFELSCKADEKLCDAYCKEATDNEAGNLSLYELCFGGAERISLSVCKQQCGRLSLDFWRCVGAARYDDREANECAGERACLDAHPPR